MIASQFLSCFHSKDYFSHIFLFHKWNDSILHLSVQFKASCNWVRNWSNFDTRRANSWCLSTFQVPTRIYWPRLNTIPYLHIYISQQSFFYQLNEQYISRASVSSFFPCILSIQIHTWGSKTNDCYPMHALSPRTSTRVSHASSLFRRLERYARDQQKEDKSKGKGKRITKRGE